MAIISNIIRIIGKPIILKLGKGLKSSKKIWCPGEEMDISLDDSVVGKDNVTGPTSSRINSLARWKDAIGKTLTDSKTIQDDDGTTQTTSTVDGELKQLIDNLSSNDSAAVVQHLRSLVKTMIRQEIKDKQIWDAYIDTTSKSYVVRGQNLEDPTQFGDFFQITRSGDNLRPFQTQALAILQNQLPNLTGDSTTYTIGSTQAWTIVKDEQNNFFAGGSTANPLSYTPKQQGTYLIRFKYGLVNTPNKAGEISARILTSITGRNYLSRGSLAQGLGVGAITDTIGILAPAGDVFTFNFTVGLSGPERRVGLLSGPLPLVDTAIFVYLLG